MKKDTSFLRSKKTIIYLIIAVLTLSFCSCTERPNKRATVSITYIMGGKDTINIEYFDNLRVGSENSLLDCNNHCKAKYIANYSILGTVSEIK